MCVCVCVCVHMCIYMCVHMHACVGRYMHICICVNVCVCMTRYICVLGEYMCICVCVGGYIWRLTHHLKVTIAGVGVTVKITNIRSVEGPGVKKPRWEHTTCRG